MGSAEITPVKGTVLRIEKSSIYDGDGLRTVIFMKGCPLRCLWCSTPESQRMEPERGFEEKKCLHCGKCAEVCPGGALSFFNGVPVFDAAACIGCLACAKVCPGSAVVPYGFEMTAEEAVLEAAKDELFYFHSGGGLTVSGGEPLMQSRFVREVFRGCAKRGIDCALESSFYAPWEEIEALLPWVSLLHIDIKHPDSARHMALTGTGNSLVIENIKRADEAPQKFGIITRTPLIPGINDSDADMEKLARIVKGLKKLRWMEFLAYHRLGAETYRRMNRPYALEGLTPPTPEHMQERAKLFKELAGVRVKVNGREV